MAPIVIHHHHHHHHHHNNHNHHHHHHHSFRIYTRIYTRKPQQEVEVSKVMGLTEYTEVAREKNKVNLAMYFQELINRVVFIFF